MLAILINKDSITIFVNQLAREPFWNLEEEIILTVMAGEKAFHRAHLT
ncbi:hypothetical protein [Thiosocius teredinicola]